MLQDGDLVHVLMRDEDSDSAERPSQPPGRALMRVAIAGAGNVGRSIAAELLDNGHEVLLIDKDPGRHQVDTVPEGGVAAGRRLRDHLPRGGRLQRCHVVIAATGDDKANLVVSLLAKTEYGVPRTVARGSTTPRTSGCSTRPGASTSPSRPRD